MIQQGRLRRDITAESDRFATSNTFSSRMMTGPHWAHVTDWKRHQGRCYDACNIIQHDQYGKSSDPLSHSLVRSMQTSSPLDRFISLKFNWLWVSLWWWSLNLSILQMYKRHLSLNSVHFVKLLNISTFVAIPIFIRCRRNTDGLVYNIFSSKL